MWGALQNPGHVEFYEEFHAGRRSETEDWMPMVRAVRYLQSIPVATELNAFTSLSRFHLTTAPTYKECDTHCSVSIIWRFSERRFHIAFGRLGEGWLEDRLPERICEESEFPVIIGPFIQRLLASAPPATDG